MRAWTVPEDLSPPPVPFYLIFSFCPNWWRASLLVVEMCGYPADFVSASPPLSPSPSLNSTIPPRTGAPAERCWSPAPVKKVEVFGVGRSRSDCSGVVLRQLFQFLLLLLSVLSGNDQRVGVAHHHLQHKHRTMDRYIKLLS